MHRTILSDISSTAMLQQIGDAQSTPMAIKDLEHHFLYANEAFCTACGFSQQDLIGKNDLEVGRSEAMVLGDRSTGWPGFWALDDEALLGGCSAINIETSSGRNRATETLRTPIQDGDGNVVALLVQLHDVSEVRDLKRRVASNLDAISVRDGEFTTIDSVLATLMACQDTNTLLAQLADVLVERTRADGACVATLQEAGELMEIVAVTGERAEELIGTTFRRNVGIMGRAWHVGESVFIEDIDKVHSLYEYRPGTQSFSVPLYVDGLAVAALTVTSNPESPDLSNDIALLERIGGMASIAIANTHLIDGTKRSLRGTHALAEVSQILPTIDDATLACDVVCSKILKAVAATRSSCFLRNSKGKLEPHVSWGAIHGMVNRAVTMPLSLTSDCIAQWSVDNDEIALIRRLDEDDRETAAVHQVRLRMNIGSTYCVPLKKQDHVMGAMLISRGRDQRDFSDAEIDLFKAVVNLLSTSIERMDLAHKLQHQAFHDRLTSLPNRHRFELELEDCIQEGYAKDEHFAVLFIDLDGFKDVNDSHGHAVGDQLLSHVAERLSGKLSERDILARMGGDEFAAILRSDPDGHATADTLLGCLNHEFCIAEEQLTVGASIGISRFPKNGDSADLLLQSADEAMYQAKKFGKGCVFTYNESLAVESRQRIRLEHQLREAIVRREFILMYQPQVRCSDSKVVGLEALIRWQHPTRGLTAPNEFIPIAESSGIINEIGAWVIDEAVRQLALWQSTTVRNLRVSINIAAPQFQLDNFCDQVLDALARHCAPPDLLELEVTESVVMHNVKTVVERLNRLRGAGIRIAIDDFGTGYSSLSYLQDLPLDVLKIDRTFVNRLSDKSDQISLVNTILLLAAGLGLETVAEGVELPEQHAEIKRLGCDLIQGYLYSRPVHVSEVPATIERIQSRMNSDLELVRTS
ncbi:EAL domain-containing protein [bacterium]|nr:EAL domain-containing protein [bacterium]